MKLFYILTGFVAALFFVFFQLPAMKWGADIASVQQRQAAGETVEMGDLMKGPAPVRWWRDHKKLNDTFNATYLSEASQGHFVIILPFEDMLNPGEAMPDDVYKDVYVAARGPSHLIKLCTELLNTIAVKCDLSKPQGKIGRDGLAQVSGLLRYVPQDDPGILPETKEAEYMNLHFSLSGREEMPYTSEMRERAFTLAQSLCDALRLQAGNCVITRVDMKPQFRRGAEGVAVLEADARLTVFADPAQVDKKALDASLEQMRKSAGL